jgi:hypothetical protein
LPLVQATPPFRHGTHMPVPAVSQKWLSQHSLELVHGPETLQQMVALFAHWREGPQQATPPQVGHPPSPGASPRASIEPEAASFTNVPSRPDEPSWRLTLPSSIAEPPSLWASGPAASRAKPFAASGSHGAPHSR